MCKNARSTAQLIKNLMPTVHIMFVEGSYLWVVSPSDTINSYMYYILYMYMYVVCMASLGGSTVNTH